MESEKIKNLQEIGIQEEDDDDGPPPGFQCIITPQQTHLKKVEDEDDEDDDDGPPPGFGPVATKPPLASSGEIKISSCTFGFMVCFAFRKD